MREIVILLLVVALVVLVIGAVNQDQTVDLDYVFGKWESVSVLSLSAICAGSAIVLGLVIAAMARLRVVADRRKLERELQLVYPRLREAEHAAGLPAWNPPVEPTVAAATGAETTAPVAADPDMGAAASAGPPPPVAAADTGASPALPGIAPAAPMGIDGSRAGGLGTEPAESTEPDVAAGPHPETKDGASADRSSVGEA